MASLRAQILEVVREKLEAVRVELDFASLLVNPRSAIGTDQLDAILLLHGGDTARDWLTAGAEERWVEFGVGWMVRETASGTAEAQLDAVYVAVTDALTDPTDVQLGGLAVEIVCSAVSEPQIGRAADGAHILAGQFCDFAVRYFTREGDASTPGP